MNARLFPLRLSRPAARTRRRAFTLLEIMVVMVIIGAVLSIAIPRFGNVFEANIKSAMRRFAGMVKFCFHEAVIKQSVLRLNVDPMTGEYWVAVLVSSGTVGQFVEADESLAARARLPHGIQFVDVVTPHDILKKEREEAFISFFPTGYAERAVVHLMDSSERFYTMVVQPLTGEVEIYDGYIDLIDVQQTQGPFGEQ